MTHADVEEAERQRVGIIDGLVRLSVGLEDVDDLIGALDKALETSDKLRAGMWVPICRTSITSTP